MTTEIGNTVQYTTNKGKTIQGTILDSHITQNAILNLDSNIQSDGIKYLIKPQSGKPFWTIMFPIPLTPR